MTPAFVDALRGTVVESQHRVHLVVARADGTLVASAGDPQLVIFARSAIKMFQALPLVEDGGIERWSLSTEELAICTASHGGESFHLQAVRSILSKIDVPETALACGPSAPLHPPSARHLGSSGQPPARLHNNCSGKHAGMLALARLHGWPLDSYHLAGHPVQQRMRATLSEWSSVEDSETREAIDGCGIPTFALPLISLAHACARLAAAAADSCSSASRIVSAMIAHPEYVAGTDRLCTDLMRASEGQVYAKVGAEGVYCAGVPSRGLGVALKVEDGATRAAEPALLATLRAMQLIDDATLDRLVRYARPEIRNTRDDVVGHLEARVRLEHA